MSSAPAGNGEGARNVPREDDYIQWPELPPGGPLNRWSHFITREHDFVAAKVSVKHSYMKPPPPFPPTYLLSLSRPCRVAQVVTGHGSWESVDISFPRDQA